MFEKFFDTDNAVWRFMGKVADLVVLNLLFILCSIPIVTIGASITAMYTVTLKMVEKKEGYIASSFFKAFKSNFKQSTIIWLILLVTGVVIVGEVYVINHTELFSGNVMNYLFAFLGFCYIMILSYVFPLQSKFENKIINTVSNAVMMGIAHFIPWTILIILANLLPLIALFLSAETVIDIVLPVMILLGFSGIAYSNSFMFKRIFARYIPKEESEEDDLENLEELEEPEIHKLISENVESEK